MNQASKCNGGTPLTFTDLVQYITKVSRSRSFFLLPFKLPLSNAMYQVFDILTYVYRFL